MARKGFSLQSAFLQFLLRVSFAFCLLSALSFPVVPFSLFSIPSHSTDYLYILFQVSSLHVSSLLLCSEEVDAGESVVVNAPLLQQEEA